MNTEDNHAVDSSEYWSVKGTTKQEQPQGTMTTKLSKFGNHTETVALEVHSAFVGAGKMKLIKSVMIISIIALLSGCHVHHGECYDWQIDIGYYGDCHDHHRYHKRRHCR